MKNIYHSLKKVLVVALLMLLTTSFYAQEAKTTFAPYWYLKANLGTSYGHTDLSRNDFMPDKDLSYLSFGGELGFGRQLTPIFGVNTKFYKGYLDGQLPLLANTKFETSLFDFTLNGTVNLSNLISGYKDRKFSFHGLLGIGQTQFNAKSWYLGVPSEFGFSTSPAARQGGGLGDRKVVLIVPMGFGVAYKINDKLSANADVTLKWTDTDVLDAHPIAGSANDYYNFFSAGVTYKFVGASIKKMVKDFDMIAFNSTPEILEEKGDMVDVEISGTIPAKYFSKTAAIHFQPILKYEGGQTELTPFTLKGEDVVGDGVLIKNETGGEFTIKDSFKYTPAMNKSELVLVPIAYSAKRGTLDSKEDILNGTKNASIEEVKIADGVIYTSERISKKMGSMVGDHMYEKETIVTKKANVYFAKNLYNLNWKLKLNKADESKTALKELGDFVKRGWDIKSIDIDGWASPEGEETFNENLSENRAKTAHKHGLKNLKKMLKAKDLNLGFETIDEVKFNVNFHGQDWDGFTKGVKASNISDKNSIFNVITRAGSTLKKEEEIRNMIVIYPEIESEILPKLRRAEVAVNAYEPKRTDKEILELIKSDPSKLSIFEKLYAAHLTECSKKLEIYKLIMKEHPKCWVSKNNAALIYMKDGKYNEAKRLLNDAHKMYPKVPTIINNLGILACNEGEYLKGEKYFLKAQELGTNVDYNLGVIEIHKGNYNKALKLFGNKTCDYNVALAQILTGNYAKAKNNLECTKGCEASNAYLMAVIGARTNNTSMLYKNLIKAVKANPELKEVAKEDREFIKYENTDDFNAIVK